VKHSKFCTEIPSSDFQAPISTFGEAFAAGAFIELVPGDSVRPNLLLWDGREQIVSEVVEYRGLRYKSRAIHDSILRELQLPRKVGALGSVRDLLSEICRLIDQFVRLPEKSTALVGRFILATWLVDGMQTAPRLLIEGPDTSRVRQLVQLLRCVCRRAIPISGVTPAALCSLPSGMRFTLLLHENSISPRLATLLQAATLRGNPFLKAGELRDLFGAQAIVCDSGFGAEAWAISSIRVPCIPIGERLPILDHEQQQCVAEDLQDKLLAFRFSNYQAACATKFDNAEFAIPLRDLSISLAAATPGNSELQGELHALLQEENTELEAANWVDVNTVLIESILVHCREAKMESVYVGALSEMATVILEGRGENRRLDPGEAGRRLKSLGFQTEPRDAQGVKLRLTDAVCVRAHNLAREFNVPGNLNGECRNVGSVGQID
jgi:hypothetical protein